jgi:spore coat protein U-like protein
MPFAVAAATVVVCGSANAGTATTTFGVKLTIQSQCKIVSASELDFGTSGVIDANIDQSNSLSVRCTKSTPYDIGLNAGANGGTVAARLMKGGPANDTIQYSLYTTAGRTVVWGNTVGTDTVSGTGTGAVQSYTVFGRVPDQTTPAAGNYTDTITVTVTY